MILGFTGTQKGMTHRQRNTLRSLFNELPLHVLHHGDCIGADAQAHKLAQDVSARIVIHPPTNLSKCAFCSGYDEMKAHLPYLLRNRAIVESARDGLIAAPNTTEEQRRSGTWSTVRYARSRQLRIWLLHPDGAFTIEE